MSPLLRCILWGGLFALPGIGRAVEVLSDDFESGGLGPAWTVTSTNAGQAKVTSDYVPAAGTKHLVLGTSLDDHVDYRTEATIQLNLLHKKNAFLSFQFKGVANRPDSPQSGPYPDYFLTGQNYDGVAMSLDGGAHWKLVSSLVSFGPAWQKLTISLDPLATAMGAPLGSDVRIRFTAYELLPTSLAAIAIDNVSVVADADASPVLILPRAVQEGAVGQTGRVSLASPAVSPVTVSLTTDVQGLVQLPASVTVPEGETEAVFDFSVADDALANLTRKVKVTATTPGVTMSPELLVVTDDEAPHATLNLPAALFEGQSGVGEILLDHPAAVSMPMYLVASISGQLSLPMFNMTISAGQTRVQFPITALDDQIIDGNRPVTVMAGYYDEVVATSTVVIKDVPKMSFSLQPEMQEGLSYYLYVSMSGVRAVPTTVYLTSSDPDYLALPEVVTIPAGVRYAQLIVSPAQNSLREGSRVVTFAAVCDVFAQASASTLIRDNDPAYYTLDPPADLLDYTHPVALAFQGLDVEGRVIYFNNKPVRVQAVLPDGTVLPTTPAVVSINGTRWTGSVTLPPEVGTVSSFTLRLVDDEGVSAESRAVQPMRSMPVAAGDVVLNPQLQHLYASIPADTGNYAGHVVEIDPVTATIVRSIFIGHKPRKLAISSGAEKLYVGRDDDGLISTVNLSDFTVSSTFTVGSEPGLGRLNAGQMVVVPGQPDLLVVKQVRAYGESMYVAVYDKGNILPKRASGVSFLAASPDGVTLYADTNYWPVSFRKLALTSEGLVEKASIPRSGEHEVYYLLGDKLYSTGGTIADASSMAVLGKVDVTGLCCADADTQRLVYLGNTDASVAAEKRFSKLSVWSLGSMTQIRTWTMTAEIPDQRYMVRHGRSGLAFGTSTTLYLVNNEAILPVQPPADLVAKVRLIEKQLPLQSPARYQVTVANTGDHPALKVVITGKPTRADGQTVQSVDASTGTPTFSGSGFRLELPVMEPGATVTINAVMKTSSAGAIDLQVNAQTDSDDAHPENNEHVDFGFAGYQTSQNAINSLPLTLSNLIYDASRGVLWGTRKRQLLQIEPRSGPVALMALLPVETMSSVVAISGDGRYLYLFSLITGEVLRIDLSHPAEAITRIKLSADIVKPDDYVYDLDVLDGDGTSFLVTTRQGYYLVIDGAVMRPQVAHTFFSPHITPTSDPSRFISVIDGFGDTRVITVSSNGTSAGPVVKELLIGDGWRLAGAGDYVLASNGALVDVNSLQMIAALPSDGRLGYPLIDLASQRAFMAIQSQKNIYAYDLPSGTLTGSFPLPDSILNDLMQSYLRWGLDGFAIRGSSQVFLFRWSGVIPPQMDSNHDGFSDAWAAASFGDLNLDPDADPDHDGIPNSLEYLYGTSPTGGSSGPVGAAYQNVDGQPGFRFSFNRRADVPAGAYCFECSPDLVHWTRVGVVNETVLQTVTINGTPFQQQTVTFPAVTKDCSFARLRWLEAPK